MSTAPDGFERIALSLQLLAEERVGAPLRAKNREDEERFGESVDRLRQDTQRERLED